MSGITCQECFNEEATMYFETVEVCSDCYHRKCNEVKVMSKSIVTTNFGRKKKSTVKEYIETNLYDNDTRGVAETADNNAEAAQKGLATLCQILTDRGLLSAEDIEKIADGFEQEHELVDDE